MTDECTNENLSGELSYPLARIDLGTVNVNVGSYTDYSLEKALVNFLSVRPSVACVFGTSYFPHFIPRSDPQSPTITYPAITYSRESAEHGHGLSGSAGFCWADIALDIWSTNYSDITKGAEVLRKELQGYSGYWGVVQIGNVIFDNESDNVERPEDASGAWYYSRSIDLRILYFESMP